MSPADRSPERTLVSLTLREPVSLADEPPPRLEPPLKTLTPLLGPEPLLPPVAIVGGVVVPASGAAGLEA